MDGNAIFELPAELLYLWHAHRVEILLSAGFVAAIVRLAWHWRSTRLRKLSILQQSKTPSVPAVILEDKTESEIGKWPIEPPPQSETKASFVPKRVVGKRKPKEPNREDGEIASTIQPIIFYYTLGGSTKAYAEKLAIAIKSSEQSQDILAPQLHDLTQIDYDDYFITAPAGVAPFYLLLIPTYNIDTELSNFLSHLQETHHDFRIDTAPLSGVAGYAVFGFGDRQEWPTEQEGFCSQAVEVDKWMARLTGGKRAFPTGMGDVKGDVEDSLKAWRGGVVEVMQDLAKGKGLGEGVAGSGQAVESGDEDSEMEDEGEREPVGRKSLRLKQKPSKATTTSDLEDLKVPIPVDFTTTSSVTERRPKPMVPVSSPTHAALTKQGYSIIGSHSGVKICRWTKSALRGRGSCYKYSFYGIASHLCMEATPSLSCSNKCVFCWRHGTNPVGTTWRWEVDPPDLIFEGMKAAHMQKIRMMRGVPGVRSERYSEVMGGASTKSGKKTHGIKHCALSLVGEPIFYPHINALLRLLHAEHISTFLVCNAQHPDQLAALDHVTQLYVSIDASSRESLRRIDRPLHRDFWERFLRCMDILRSKRFVQRTVFRLTLVKGFNVDEVAGYADLVARALPGFVEVKGVTYCGTSTAAGAGLTMGNVPFWEECRQFVLALGRELEKRGLEYGVAAEHQHSCCLLLADKTRFLRTPKHETSLRDDASGTDTAVGEKKWHTLIDYEAFFRCLERGEEFGPEDYIGAPTPEWALWGKGGFDPRDERVDRKGRVKEVVGAGEGQQEG